MTNGSAIATIVDALGLPVEARVDRRVPKKLLTEQGAPTAADKRAIQDGIEDLHWLAALKPSTVAIPAFKDDTREYLEIAVVTAAFRETAKAARLTELIHRAIPYPVMLVTCDECGVSVSAAHKRHAQNELGRSVIEQIVVANGLLADADPMNSSQVAFLKSLSLAQQRRTHLFALYTGWITRIEAINAARLTGVFAVSDDQETVHRRREALDAYARLAKEIEVLRSRARRELKLSRRAELNMEIQRREADLAGNTKWL